MMKTIRIKYKLGKTFGRWPNKYVERTNQIKKNTNFWDYQFYNVLSYFKTSKQV